jgi:hypothetical protein
MSARDDYADALAMITARHAGDTEAARVLLKFCDDRAVMIALVVIAADLVAVLADGDTDGERALLDQLRAGWTGSD